MGGYGRCRRAREYGPFSDPALACPMPGKECAECGAAVAVARFFFRAKFGKGLADLRKIKHMVVSEAVSSPGRFQQDAFSSAAECVQRLAVPGPSKYADEARGALCFWHPFEFAH